MAGSRRRPARRGPGPPSDAAVPAAAAGDDQDLAALDEIQRLLGTPLVDLVGTPEAVAEVTELSRHAAAVPAMARLREVVAFVGKGRAGTQAGNLRAADAAALAEQLATGERPPEAMRSMDDVPEAARAFRWAAAGEFLARRGTKVVPGPMAADLERDPIAAWFKATVTLLEHGVLDGFRQGWRKSYVELIDAGVAELVVAMAEPGRLVPVATIEAAAWADVAAAYGYEADDDVERAHVVRLVGAMVSELGDIGIAARHDDEVELTELGRTLAAVIALSGGGGGDDQYDEDDDLDLVDTDAQSLLAVCAEEMDPAEAIANLSAWCDARPADEAAAELCEAMLDDDDPDIWELGFGALAMIDRTEAERAVRQLRSHPGLRPLAAAWLRRHGQGRRRPGSPRRS